MRRQTERPRLAVEDRSRAERVVVEARAAAAAGDDGEATAQLVEDVQEPVSIGGRKNLQRRPMQRLGREESVTDEHRDTVALLMPCDPGFRMRHEDERAQRVRDPRAAEPRPELAACRRGGRSIEEEAKAEKEPVFRLREDHVWRSDRSADPAE